MSKPPSRYALLELLARALYYLKNHGTFSPNAGELKTLISEIELVAGEVEL